MQFTSDKLLVTLVYFLSVVLMCCTVVEMGRTRKRGPNRFRSCQFTFVRDPSLKKVDQKTHRIHSQLMLASILSIWVCFETVTNLPLAC